VKAKILIEIPWGWHVVEKGEMKKGDRYLSECLSFSLREIQREAKWHPVTASVFGIEIDRDDYVIRRDRR
jgi:hypothetical protein